MLFIAVSPSARLRTSMFNLNRIILIIIFLVVFDVFIWGQILFFGPTENTEIYALNVGQGDSELVILPGGVKILIDGGPDNKVLGELSSIFRPTDRYIDLVLMSHPQTDHFTGLIDVLKRYKVGVFISSGKRGVVQSFDDLEKTIQENKIPAVVLTEGDKIKYNDGSFNILSPSKNLLESSQPNDWALAMKLASQGVTALFTADIDSKIEESLLKKYDLDVDILKVPHHGSKFSSSEEFLKAVTPKVALIEVGEKNTYGHPTPQTLEKLFAAGAQIFRTDQSGIVKLVISDSKINIFKKK